MHKKIAEIITKTKEGLLKKKVNQRSFSQSILKEKSDKMAIIAEIKLASPSEGNLGQTDEICKRVQQYQLAGANCISIVTEKHFFMGDPEFIRQIKKTISLPTLQKDFVIDPYQVYQAKILGADAILLIARIVSPKQLILLVNLSNQIGIEPVVEINNQTDLRNAIKTKTKIIAVNARDLDTFKIDIDKACQLLKKIPYKFIKLGFSGIHSKVEVEKYKNAGAKAVLVGTQLMKTNNITKLIKELKNVS